MDLPLRPLTIILVTDDEPEVELEPADVLAGAPEEIGERRTVGASGSGAVRGDQRANQ